MNTHVPEDTAPMNAVLDYIDVKLDNRIEVGLRFDDGTSIDVAFAPGSEESERILGLLSDVTTDTLRRLGARGVLITGLTPPEDAER